MTGSVGEPCRCCALVRDPATGAEPVGRYWTINRNVDMGTRPRYVLQVREHRPSLGDLTAGEAEELGPILRSVVPVLRDACGASNVHVMYANEIVPPHVHVHLVPRFAGDPHLVDLGPDLAGNATAPWPAADEIVARLEYQQASTPRVVLAVVRVAQAIQALLPYGPLRRLLASRWRGDFAPPYVFAWLTVLAGALAVSATVRGAAGWACVAVALVRVLDVASYEALILLGGHGERTLEGFERSLVLLVLNLVELVLAGAVMLVVTEGDRAGSALLAAFSMVGLYGLPGTDTAAGAVLIVLVATTALMLLAGGVSLLVGVIGAEFRRRT